MKHTSSVSIRSVYIFLLFLIYQRIFKIMDLSLNTTFYGVFLMMCLSYYVMDLFNFELIKYRAHDFILSTFITVSGGIFSYIFTKKIIYFQMFLIFLLIQNFLRWTLIRLTGKKMKVAIIGNNKINEEVLKPILDSEKYEYAGKFSKEAEEETGEKYIGCFEEMSELVKKNRINKMIITEDRLEKRILREILGLKLKGIKVINYESFNEEIQGKVDVKNIDENWFLNGSGFNILHNVIQKKIKRLFDITLALLIFILTLPIMLLSIIIIKLESHGPALFKQERVGLGDQEFTIYKFRSMRNDAEKDGAKWAQKNDSRVTKFGNFMRKTRIDELPQLWNVLKGDMSFVGPRPERQVFIDDLEKEIPFYNLRHCVKPGLTGWAQVMYPYGASIEDSLRKLEYDLYYIKHQNFIMDIFIFFKTVKTVLFGKGR